MARIPRNEDGVNWTVEKLWYRHGLRSENPKIRREARALLNNPEKADAELFHRLSDLDGLIGPLNTDLRFPESFPEVWRKQWRPNPAPVELQADVQKLLDPPAIPAKAGFTGTHYRVESIGSA